MISEYVKKYCEDYTKIENYDKAIADKTQTWECHHRNEQYFPRKTLIAIGWYYDCRPDELIFLTVTEHNSLHHKYKKVSDEAKKKISEANKGKQLSEETREKMSKAHKNKKHNYYSRRNKGMHWYNNGIVQMQAFECPEGFVKGTLPK